MIFEVKYTCTTLTVVITVKPDHTVSAYGVLKFQYVKDSNHGSNYGIPSL